MIRRHIALTASATAMAVASIVGTGVAVAASGTTKTAPHRRSTAVQREARYEDRLDRAVSNGKLTSSQKMALLSKHQQLEQSYIAAKQLSGDARKVAVQKVWRDAKTWATANNLPVRYLLGFRSKPL